MTNGSYKLKLRSNQTDRVVLEIYDEEIGVIVQTVELVISNLSNSESSEINIQAISSDFSTEISPV